MKINVKESTIIPSVTIFFSLISIGLICLNLQSCEKDETDGMDYSLNIPSEYTQVGKLHNQGLNYIIATIKEANLERVGKVNSSTKNALSIDFSTIAKNSTLQFCEEHKITEKNLGLCKAAIEEAQVNLVSTKMRLNRLEGLNETQKEFIKEILSATKVKYNKENLENLKETLDEINYQAKKNLSEDEAVSIYCATSTAYASFQYWNKNYKKWYFALNYPEIFQEYSDVQLNKVSIKNKVLSQKSDTTSSDSEPWWEEYWSDVEEWWDDSWDDELENEWFYNALMEMGEADIYGATGGSLAGIPGAIAGGCLASAIEGADQLLDKNDD